MLSRDRRNTKWLVSKYSYCCRYDYNWYEWFCLIMLKHVYIYIHILIISFCFLPSLYLSWNDKSIETKLFKCKSILTYLGYKILKTKHSSTNSANYFKIHNTFGVVHGIVIVLWPDYCFHLEIKSMAWENVALCHADKGWICND